MSVPKDLRVDYLGSGVWRWHCVPCTGATKRGSRNWSGYVASCGEANDEARRHAFTNCPTVRRSLDRLMQAVLDLSDNGQAAKS